MNRKTFWLILIVFHAGFFMKQAFLHNSLIQDSREYLYAADNLLDHGTIYAWNLNFAQNPDWLTKRPFLYPVIISAFKILSFGSDHLFFILIYLAQNLLSLLNIRLTLKVADKYNPGYSLPKVLLFLTLSVSQMIYANLIMCEIWLQSCFVIIAYQMLMRADEPRKYLIIALSIIAAMALKPVAMPAAFVFPILLFISKRKIINWQYLAIGLLPLVFALSYTFINAKRTGYAQYSSISTINTIHYNTYVLLMNKYGTEKADSTVDAIKLQTRGMTYADRQRHIESSCRQIIIENAGKYSYLHFRGILFALTDPGRFDITQFFNLPHEGNLIYQTNQEGLFDKLLKVFLNPLGILLLTILVFNLFRLFRALVFFFQKKYDWKLKFIIFLIPAYVLALTGPIGTSRFFMPLIPFALLAFILSLKVKSR